MLWYVKLIKAINIKSAIIYIPYILNEPSLYCITIQNWYGEHNDKCGVKINKNRIESTNIYTVTEFFVSICYILLHLGVQKNEYYTTLPK